MKKKAADHVENTKQLIRKCLNDGFSLAGWYSKSESGNPTWDDVRDYALKAYATALEDVLDALNGRPNELRNAASEEGRLLVTDEEALSFMERLLEFSGNAPDGKGLTLDGMEFSLLSGIKNMAEECRMAGIEPLDLIAKGMKKHRQASRSRTE